MDIKTLFSTFQPSDFFSKVNLHIHSTYSDGKYDFDTLVEQAQTLNLEYISITDHNTIEGYKNSKYKNANILIPGVEFDCFYKMSLLHILGYGIDIENEKIQALCANEKNDFRRILNSRHPKTVIEAIHDAKGIAILAHPCCCNVISLDNFVKNLKTLGLDGIETHYPYNRFRGIIKFSSRELPYKLAKKYNLIQTGGTDCHGELKFMN